MSMHAAFEARGESAVRRVGESDFRKVVIEGSHLRPVCVEFWTRRGDLRFFSDPTAEQVADALGGKALVAEMNVEDNPVISGSYEIRATPTMLVFKRGVVVEKVVGAVPPKAIADRLFAWADATLDRPYETVSRRSWTNAG